LYLLQRQFLTITTTTGIKTVFGELCPRQS
jgi:hypothetical protein